MAHGWWVLRGGALLLGGVLVAASDALGIGLGGLSFEPWLVWVAMISGVAAAGPLAHAIRGPAWVAPVVLVGLHGGAAILLARLELLWWPTDVRLASPATTWRIAAQLGLGALVCLGLSWLRRTDRRRLAGGLAAGLALTSLVALALVAGGLREVGLLPFAHGGRVAAFDRLWRNLERYYARWDPAVLPALRDRYRARVVAAADGCGWFGDCPAYHAAIRDMLAELHDGHTRIGAPDDRAVPPATPIEPIDGAAMIVRGRWRGFVVIAIDGRGVDAMRAAIPPHALVYSAPHTGERGSYTHLLAGPPGTPVFVELEAPSGERVRTLLWRSAPLDAPAQVAARLLAPHTGYISIPHLRSADVVERFEAGLAALGALRGLVLDLRGNGGGWSGYGAAIASRLLVERVVYGTECFRARHPLRGIAGCIEHAIEPRPPVAAARVAVLLDGDVASSAEQMALALCSTGRARCFGTTTAGDSGNPRPHFLPGMVVLFSTGELYGRDGARLDGTGVRPHEQVRLRRADVIADRDPVLEAAARWLAAP